MMRRDRRTPHPSDPLMQLAREALAEELVHAPDPSLLGDALEPGIEYARTPRAQWVQASDDWEAAVLAVAHAMRRLEGRARHDHAAAALRAAVAERAA